MGRLKALKPAVGTLAPRVAYQSREEAEAERFRQRDAERESRGWYKTARWRKLRLKVLDRDNWTCSKTGVLLTGKYPAPNSPVVDHIVQHRGDPVLFWAEDNLQSLTKAYHDSEKQRQERGRGALRGMPAAAHAK
ncbi:MAG: HNH endonuclease [Parvibaculum sp.]|uniref:HNH endonuclease n=1 Tax=Parvibaculum sp. TaxID=2024848 RepID=UPI002ABCB2B2|nr:HNH endonuclease [Parvibaculum sp.]MDZ4382819.1 HNH endonuclease [Parvibaculum sp.]